MINLITENIDIWTAVQTQKTNGGRGRGNGSANQSQYGIKKLRELILELAVRGKLVSQDPNDEPASFLLEKIAKEKKRLIKENKIKKQTSLPKITEDEKPFELPDGWEWERLGNIAEIIRGVTYKKHDAQDNSFEGSIALMRANNIGYILNFDNIVYIPKALVKEEQIIIYGDLIIAMSSGSADLVGKAAQADSDIDATFGAFCGVIRANSAELWQYFSFFFKTPIYRDQAMKYGKGIGINNLSKSSLENLLVSLPPLAEQHRIVAKVDEFMALCDQLEQKQTDSNAAHKTLVDTLLATLTRAADKDEFIETWERIAKNFDILFTTEHSIDQLKQTILQLAVMGKLVPQDPNDEPASVLLGKIAKEKAKLVKEGKIKKEKPMSMISEDENPFELPFGWSFVRLGSFSKLITKGSSPNWQGITYTDNSKDVLFITSENVGIYVLELNHRKYVEKKFNELEPRSILEKGDFLMNIVGASIGRTAIYNIDDLANINQAVCLIRVFSNFLNSQYLLHFFNSKICISYMFNKQVDNARANLSMGNISNFVIPFPPLNEQHRIVAKVDELMALCDSLKARLNDAQATQVQLSDAIVEQAAVAYEKRIRKTA